MDKPVIMKYFAYSHLPPHLAEVSKIFADAVERVLELTPPSAEQTVALRKMLEAR